EYFNIHTGKLSWIAYAPVPINNWSVGIVFPVDELMADVNNLYLNLIVLVFGGLIFIFLVIVFISRSVTRPLRRLTEAAGNFARGDFDVPLPAIRSKNEIGKLNTSFIYMQKTLASTLSDLRVASENLRITNEKLEEYNRTLEQKVEARTAELKEKNKELDASFQNIRILNEIGREITSTLNLEVIQAKVHKHVNSLLDATGFLIMIYDQKKKMLDCRFAVENGERLQSFGVPMKETNRFPVWCVNNAAPVFMNDVENEYQRYVPDRPAPKAGKPVSSLIYIPLMIEGRVLGVISTQSYEKNAYSEYQFDMLNNLANFIAIAFDNAFSYEKINKANSDLKAAQAQLVQSEKMASLGQLTAGIAHEIKNPLNFVNNFAELSIDLARELEEEVEKLSDNLEEKDVDFLREMIGDIRMNIRRINDHGKRADSIVRGMLLHSRGQSGEMQPTDINALLAEYVNLGYHGMRAQDPNFNIKIESDYDKSIGLINVVPQNLSRVFLNIINNACYATHEKKKQLKDAYFPVLSVSTKNKPETVEIHIRDNGKGIPREVLEKVFNPFFTTKPPGQGTGLGLSLSYDIVVQEHKGTLKVESTEGEYAEFLIDIPKNL
ncbi:MAG: ATP-binding protein, partial [Bacteroidales bacterium]